MCEFTRPASWSRIGPTLIAEKRPECYTRFFFENLRPAVRVSRLSDSDTFLLRVGANEDGTGELSTATVWRTGGIDEDLSRYTIKHHVAVSDSGSVFQLSDTQNRLASTPGA